MMCRITDGVGSVPALTDRLHFSFIRCVAVHYSITAQGLIKQRERWISNFVDVAVVVDDMK